MGYVLLFLKNMSPQKQTKKVFKSIRDVPSAFNRDLKIRRRLTSATASGGEITVRIISGCRRCEVSRRSAYVCNVTEAILPLRLKRE